MAHNRFLLDRGHRSGSVEPYAAEKGRREIVVGKRARLEDWHHIFRCFFCRAEDFRSKSIGQHTVAMNYEMLILDWSDFTQCRLSLLEVQLVVARPQGCFLAPLYQGMKRIIYSAFRSVDNNIYAPIALRTLRQGQQRVDA
jgi:hypothetical protein